MTMTMKQEVLHFSSTETIGDKVCNQRWISNNGQKHLSGSCSSLTSLSRYTLFLIPPPPTFYAGKLLVRLKEIDMAINTSTLAAKNYPDFLIVFLQEKFTQGTR